MHLRPSPTHHPKNKRQRSVKLRQHIITLLCYTLRIPFALLDTIRRLFTQRARQHPQSIVVIKPCCLGDLLMTTPLLEVIHHAYPQASITYVAGTYSKVVPEHHPAINTVIDSGTVGIPGRYSFYDYMKIANVLRKHHFDLAFVLDRSPMLTLLPWLAGIPRRIGPDSLGRGFSLTDRVPVSTSPTQLQHQAEIYLDLARAIGLPINHPRMRFEPTQHERSDVVGARFIAPVGQGEANTTQHEPSDAVGADLSRPPPIYRPTEYDDPVGPRFIAPVGQGEANTSQSEGVGARFIAPTGSGEANTSQHEPSDPVGPRFIAPAEGGTNTSQDEPSDVVGARFIAPVGQGEANTSQHEPSDPVGADLSCPPPIYRPTGLGGTNTTQSANPIHIRVAVFPGGGSNPGMELTAKRWPLERYRELARKLIHELDAEVLLIGGPEDIDLNQRLLEGLDVSPGTITNLAGKTTIGQLAAHLEQCALFIGNDSSPMHLAAAVGTPVIAIFGPTSPQEYGPYPLDDPKHIALWHHPTGQPCFFLGKMQTCTTCTCIQSVTVDEVWDAVISILPAQLPETQ